MSHYRVIPRDFFNEAKLLKCLGRFELVINHTGPNIHGFKSSHDGKSFEIIQNRHDGSLYVSNYEVILKGEKVDLWMPYNNKTEIFPLYCEYLGKTYRVLNDAGEIIFEEC